MPSRLGPTRAILGAINLSQRLHDLATAESEPWRQRRREAGECIDHREHAKLMSGRQLVIDDVHRQVSFERAWSACSYRAAWRLRVLLHDCDPTRGRRVAPCFDHVAKRAPE